MKKTRLWVHRLSASEGGTPTATVGLKAGFDPCRVLDQLLMPPVALMRDEEESRRFLFDELHAGRLRQGWGFPGLDLRSADFHDNFVIAMGRYWGAISEEQRTELRSLQTKDASSVFRNIGDLYRRAEGRYRVLIRMQQMSAGDIVFVPNVPKDVDSFGVARIVDQGYTFDRRGSPSSKFFSEVDFGHRRDVADVRVFAHSPETLATSAFGAPYRHAIDPASPRPPNYSSDSSRLTTRALEPLPPSITPIRGAGSSWLLTEACAARRRLESSPRGLTRCCENRSWNP